MPWDQPLHTAGQGRLKCHLTLCVLGTCVASPSPSAGTSLGSSRGTPRLTSQGMPAMSVASVSTTPQPPQNACATRPGGFLV